MNENQLLKWTSQPTASITHAMCSVMTGIEVLVQDGISWITCSYDIQNIKLYMEQFSLGKNTKFDRMTPSHQANEREISSKQEGKADTHSHQMCEPPAGRSKTKRKRTQNLKFLPEEWKVHTYHGASQLLWLTPDRYAPKAFGFKDQQGLCP